MCEISFKNSQRLLRKWQKTLGDTFFAAHCTCSTVGGLNGLLFILLDVETRQNSAHDTLPDV